MSTFQSQCTSVINSNEEEKEIRSRRFIGYNRGFKGRIVPYRRWLFLWWSWDVQDHRAVSLLKTKIYHLPVLFVETVRVLSGLQLAMWDHTGDQRYSFDNKFNWRCGNKSEWESQTYISNTPTGNILLSAAILFNGASYAKTVKVVNPLTAVSRGPDINCL